jgi:tRNA G18 (ribose-2'-O)-methylase SpoU
MPPDRIIRIDSPTDPRLTAYTNLKEREIARQGGRFIAEGELVVKRLLASSYSTESVLLADRRVEEIAPLVPAGVQIYAGPTDVVHRIVGFKFHAGVMACGIRGRSPSLFDAAESWADDPVTLVVCPEISNTENLGSMIRLAAAFGAQAIILGELSCDPFFRQSIRVSMGTVFQLPIIQSQNLRADLRELSQRYAVQLVATVLSADAEPLSTARRLKRTALLFGNEAQGLSAEYINLCDRRITIPMHMGTDSLNVSAAAGIILYHFTQYAQP